MIQFYGFLSLFFFILEPFLWPWNLYTLWMKESKTDCLHLKKIAKVQKIYIFLRIHQRTTESFSHWGSILDVDAAWSLSNK